MFDKREVLAICGITLSSMLLGASAAALIINRQTVMPAQSLSQAELVKLLSESTKQYIAIDFVHKSESWRYTFCNTPMDSDGGMK